MASGDSVRSSALALPLRSLVLSTMMTFCVARNPDGLVVVSRHGVRRQFPSSTHDFAKYAPNKVFATEDEVRVPCEMGRTAPSRKQKLSPVTTEGLELHLFVTCITAKNIWRERRGSNVSATTRTELAASVPRAPWILETQASYSLTSSSLLPQSLHSRLAVGVSPSFFGAGFAGCSSLCTLPRSSAAKSCLVCK